jgi:hypothetical protein
MAIKVFGSKFKTPGATQAPGGDEAAAAMAAGAAVESARREAQIAQAKAAQAAQEKTELERKLAEAEAAREAEVRRNAILSAINQPGRTAINPAHVLALVEKDFVMHNGKVVSKADPTQEVGPAMEKFLGDNKYLLAPVVPGGGANVPGTQTAPPPAPAKDYKSTQGLTKVVHGITHKLFTQPGGLMAPAPAANPNSQAAAPNGSAKQ